MDYMQMGMADEADVAHAHAVACELVLDHVFMELQATHAESFHDLVGAVAGVDDNRVGAPRNEKAQRQYAARASTVAAEHQETRFQFDVAIVKNLDFQRHVYLPCPVLFFVPTAKARGVKPGLACDA